MGFRFQWPLKGMSDKEWGILYEGLRILSGMLRVPNIRICKYLKKTKAFNGKVLTNKLEK
jgi:hypothetical protein